MGQGLAARACPTAPARSRAAGGTGAAPAPGIGQLPGDHDGLRMGEDVGPWTGPAWQGPWPDRAGCEELEADPAVASLGQGLTAPVG